MHLLYPSAPDRSNAVDELFAEEYDAARSAGLACSLFCDEELESGRFRARPEFPANTQVLYRGWMLTPENYARLHGAILVAVGDNPERIRNEAAFAKLCGVAPLPANSGKRTNRHRLNPDGNRHANNALWHIVLTRVSQREPRTAAYVKRRRDEGLTNREIFRCLKRYVAREVFIALPR